MRIRNDGAASLTCGLAGPNLRHHRVSGWDSAHTEAEAEH
jgi:hypothetical protein